MNRPHLMLATTCVALAAAGLFVVVAKQMHSVSPVSLEFAPPEVRVGGLGSESDSVPVTVALHNHGATEVELISVKSPCSCIATDSVAGLAVPAHSSVNLRFRVSLPEAGSRVSAIAVYFAGQQAPLELRVIATGRRELPLLRTVRNPRISFLALRSTTESFDDLVIETREEKGSPKWISGVSCDLPQVRVVSRAVLDDARPSDSFVDRSYPFTVTWTELPPDAEFSGLLRARTRDEEEIVVGRIIGSLASGGVLSPAIVELSPPAVVSETVLIDSRSGSWALASDADVPDWLSLEWTTTPQGPGLIVALDNAVPLESQRVTVPLVSRDGLHAGLEVIVRRAESR